MKRNAVIAAHTKGIALLLAAGLVAGSVPDLLSGAKAKKPKLSAARITVKAGKSKKVRVKNAQKVTWILSKKGKKIVKLSNRSKKGVTIRGLKRGTAKITVKMKTGKKIYKKTITVRVQSTENGSVQKNVQNTSVPTPNAGHDTGTRPIPVKTQEPTDTGSPVPPPTQTATPLPGVTTASLSLSGFKNGSGSGTVKYDAASAELKAENVKYFHIPLPEKVTAGTTVDVLIKGTYNGKNGFRVWLASDADGNFSEQPKSTDSNLAGDFVWSVSLTATDQVGYIEFKGITWEHDIDELVLKSIDVSYKMNTVPTPTPVALPSDLPAEQVPVKATSAPGIHATAGLPLMYTDVPDMDYIRVGEDYYMVSTTMFLNPGVPIMHSTDLVHWEIISYVYDTLEDNDITNLQNGKQCYGKGSWAASLRYNEADETYYVCFSSNDQAKTYIYTTKDIAGGMWEKHSASGTKHDPGLIFDDGKMYVISGNGNIVIQEAELSGDQIIFKGSARTIIQKTASSNTVNIEGSHAYKIGAYYYLFFIEWPGNGKRMEWCYRSSSLTGEWEGKVVFCDDGDYKGAGIAQGGIVDTKYGDWYAILFQDHGPVGRVPVLLDVYWVDGWPMMGSDNGKASASEALDVNLTSAGRDYIYADDAFDYTENKLQLVWQWNHNPDNENWSVTEREGYLRLKTGSLASSIKDARNSLTQRTYGPRCTSEVGMDVSNMKAGDYAGICAFQTSYGQIGVMKDEAGKTWLYYGSGKDTMTIKDVNKTALDQDTVYLQIQYNFSSNTAAFYYSLDGAKWNRLGDSLSMNYDLTVFMGYRTYLYNYATTQTGGSVDFDYYKIYD